MANKQHDIIQLNSIRKSWKTVNPECLDTKKAQIFLNRKQAIDMYIDGYCLKDIEEVTSIKMTKYSVMIKKCMELDESGVMYGYTALIPNKHLKQYERNKDTINGSSNYSGALMQLLHRYPRLKENIETLYLQRNQGIKEKNIKPIIIFEAFLKQCKELGIKENEYPFNTNSLGKRSFYRYIKSLENQYSNEAIMRYHKNAIQKYKSTGIGTQTDYPRLRPFSKVQIDGHKVDLIATIKLIDENGDISYVPIKRFWLLTLIDVATRVILGYHLTIKEEYDRFDILLCLKNAIEPKKRMNFSIPGLQYAESGGYHSMEIEDAKWALFDEIELDNALAHHAQIAVTKITDYLNAAMSFGPVSTPERRGIVERFFGKLEERGYHRIASTTGSNINDPRRQDCEVAAIKYQISFQDIIEITEILIANYNLSSHKNLKDFSPIEIMKQRMERGLLPSKLEEKKQQNFSLLHFSKTRQVRGSIKTGRRPYIQFEDTEYRSNELSYDNTLLGKTIVIQINPEDLRTVVAYKSDGSEIGSLHVAGKWGNTPHTLKQRKEINKYFRLNRISLTPYDDPIAIYHEYLSTKSKENKAARNKLGDLRITTGKEVLNPTNADIVPISHKEKINQVNRASNSRLLSKEELLATFSSDAVSAVYQKKKEG